MSANADKQHAAFCERQFVIELFRRIRLWKADGKPEKR